MLKLRVLAGYIFTILFILFLIVLPRISIDVSLDVMMNFISSVFLALLGSVILVTVVLVVEIFCSKLLRIKRQFIVQGVIFIVIGFILNYLFFYFISGTANIIIFSYYTFNSIVGFLVPLIMISLWLLNEIIKISLKSQVKIAAIVNKGSILVPIMSIILMSWIELAS